MGQECLDDGSVAASTWRAPRRIDREKSAWVLYRVPSRELNLSREESPLLQPANCPYTRCDRSKCVNGTTFLLFAVLKVARFQSYAWITLRVALRTAGVTTKICAKHSDVDELTNLCDLTIRWRNNETDNENWESRCTPDVLRNMLPGRCVVHGIGAYPVVVVGPYAEARASMWSRDFLLRSSVLFRKGFDESLISFMVYGSRRVTESVTTTGIAWLHNITTQGNRLHDSKASGPSLRVLFDDIESEKSYVNNFRSIRWNEKIYPYTARILGLTFIASNVIKENNRNEDTKASTKKKTFAP